MESEKTKLTISVLFVVLSAMALAKILKTTGVTESWINGFAVCLCAAAAFLIFASLIFYILSD